MQIWNRRHFLKTAAAVSAATMAASRARAEAGRNVFTLTSDQEPTRPVAANDHIQIALIGAGGQGMYDTGEAVQVPGVKLVAVADCYSGRLERSKEIWGADTFTTRDYNEILARKRRRCGDHRHAGPLAQAGVGRLDEGRQGCLLRKAHDS